MNDANNNEPPPEGGANEAPDAVAELTAKLAAAEAQVAELKDRVLRVLAEQENQRRRLEREREDSVKYAIARFARDLLTVADNLQRALAADGGAESPEAPRTGIAAGVAATERELTAAFERHGVRRIDPLGQKFDPHFHQAVFEVPDATNPPGTVVNVAAPGYVIGDRLLRAAMVGVAKAAPGAGQSPSHIDTKA
jgi:molecular chaperone GrpE